MIESQKKCQIQKSSFMLELQEQLENLETPQLNAVQCIEDMNINKSNGQQEEEVLFQEFIKGIPDECVREMHAQDKNFQNDVVNVDKRQNNQMQNEDNEQLCDIQQLSSISLVEQRQDQIPNIQNQFQKNEIKQEQSNSQKLESLLKSSQEDDQDLPFNAGFGDFLKEMQRLAKDVSFEEDTHDIWTEETSNKDENYPQSLIQLQQSNFQKIGSTYVIDFSEEKDENGQIDKLITQVQSASKRFLKKQNVNKTEELNLSQKEREYIEKLKQLFILGQQIRNIKSKKSLQK